MRAAMSQLNSSARVYHRILKLSSTIADSAGNEEIQPAFGRGTAIQSEVEDGVEHFFEGEYPLAARTGSKESFAK